MSSESRAWSDYKVNPLGWAKTITPEELCTEIDDEIAKNKDRLDFVDLMREALHPCGFVFMRGNEEARQVLSEVSRHMLDHHKEAFIEWIDAYNLNRQKGFPAMPGLEILYNVSTNGASV